MKLFISYSRDDARNFAKHIHEYFREKGYDVFIDVNDIRIGTPWANSIEKNISECDIFIVLLTPDSITSPYVEREVLQAQRENKMIVPCRHEYVDYNEIKWELDKIQGINFVNEYQLALNLHYKIKNYKNVQNEKPYSITQQQAIEKTNISENVDTLNEKGNALFNQRKYQEALEWFDKVLEIDPKNVNAVLKKSLILMEQGKVLEGLDFLGKSPIPKQFLPDDLLDK